MEQASDLRSHEGIFAGLLHHAYCIWLFTYSDLKTIVFPQTLFGLLAALSKTRTTAFTVSDELSRVLLVFGWVYINLLPFDINNQRQAGAIREDELNKPWRTMPSRRWTPNQAFYAMWLFYLIAGLASWYLGALRWSLCLMILGCCYNNLGGSDVDPLIRNLINALGYTCFGAGALEIALDTAQRFESVETAKPACSGVWGWTALVALIVLTTVQTQDMEDQMGDAERGRRSLPLQIGDAAARWVTAIFILIWAPICPVFWESSWLGYVTTMPWALTVADRSLAFRGIVEDKATFRLWNVWIMSIYLLPVLP